MIWIWMQSACSASKASCLDPGHLFAILWTRAYVKSSGSRSHVLDIKAPLSCSLPFDDKCQIISFITFIIFNILTSYFGAFRAHTPSSRRTPFIMYYIHYVYYIYYNIRCHPSIAPPEPSGPASGQGLPRTGNPPCAICHRGPCTVSTQPPLGQPDPIYNPSH